MQAFPSYSTITTGNIEERSVIHYWGGIREMGSRLKMALLNLNPRLLLLQWFETLSKMFGLHRVNIFLT